MQAKLFNKASLKQGLSREQKAALRAEIGRLERYGRGEVDPLEAEVNEVLGEDVTGLRRLSLLVRSVDACALHYSGRANASILLGEPQWRTQWERGVVYHYWAAHLRMASYLAHENATPEQQSRMWGGGRVADSSGLGLPHRTSILLGVMGELSFSRTAFTLGNCIALGWLHEARCLAKRIYSALDRGWFFDGSCNPLLPCRTQHFLLRLVIGWQGWPVRTDLPCHHDVPVFNSLIAHWRTPDVQMLRELLLQALDRHAEQTQHKTNDVREFRDCAAFDQVYNPMEVLSVLRLREVLGLPNPGDAQTPGDRHALGARAAVRFSVSEGRAP
jgi:hypothetical protein